MYTNVLHQIRLYWRAGKRWQAIKLFLPMLIKYKIWLPIRELGLRRC